MASSPPLHVLTDTHLLKHITSFGLGIPWPLYEFWLPYHEEAGYGSVLDVFYTSYPVVVKIVEHGSLHLLDLATRVRLPEKTRNFSRLDVTLNLHVVVHVAIDSHRPEAFSWGLAYQREHIDTLTRSSDKSTPVELWKRVVRGFRDGDGPMLDVLKRELPLETHQLQDIFTQRFVKSNVKNIELLEWLLTELPKLQIERRALKHAALRGDLEMVKYLHKRGGCGRCNTNTFATLCIHRQQDALAFLLEHDLIDVDQDHGESMVENNEPLVQQYSPRFQRAFEAVVQNAVADGNVAKVLSLLERDGLNTDFPISIDKAAGYGRLEVIKILHERGLATATTEAMDQAAENEHWDVVVFLHAHRTEGCTTRTMDAAAEQMSFANLKFLHENRTEGCSPRAMTEAAKQPNTKVLRFLHEHTNAPCTTEAMDAAATEGHLHVVRFLHENRSEGCTINAVKGALRSRKPQLIVFLREHYPQFFDHELLHDALLFGAFDLFSDLRLVYPEEADAVVSNVAFEAGKEMELATIHFIVNVLKRTDVASRAMDGAAERVRCGQDQWLRAVFAVTGPQSCRLTAVQSLVESINDYRDVVVQALPFVVSVCCDEGARELALNEALRCGRAAIVEALTDGATTNELRPLHPFLLDVRVSSWAITAAFECMPFWHDPYWRYRGQFTWALRAVYADDMAVLEVLRDIPEGAHPRHNCHGYELDADEIAHRFSFCEARAAAARSGNLPILQWLFEHIDLPVEPTLLTEAVFYHKFDVTLWLVNHHPEACTETNWASMAYVPWLSSCALDDELFDWLEAHDSVRSALDLGAIIDATSHWGDGLRMLYKRYPELVMARPNLIELASKHDDSDDDARDAVAFLTEIGYRDHELSVE